MKRKREPLYVTMYSNDGCGKDASFGGTYDSLEDAKADALILNQHLNDQMKEHHDEECPNVDCWPAKERKKICRCNLKTCKKDHPEDFNDDCRCIGIPKMTQLPAEKIGKPSPRIDVSEKDYERFAKCWGIKEVFEHESLTSPIKIVYIPHGKREEIEQFRCEWVAIMEV